MISSLSNAFHMNFFDGIKLTFYFETIQLVNLMAHFCVVKFRICFDSMKTNPIKLCTHLFAVFIPFFEYTFWTWEFRFHNWIEIQWTICRFTSLPEAKTRHREMCENRLLAMDFIPCKCVDTHRLVESVKEFKRKRKTEIWHKHKKTHTDTRDAMRNLEFAIRVQCVWANALSEH